MKVIRAAEMGMCFGVRDALAATRAVAEPATVTIHGELVHNQEVNADLRRRGFVQSGEGSREIPATPRVLITAHGVSDRERERLARAGKEILDTTCPLVRFAHQTALALARDGWFVVVVGKPGHVEVEGLTGDLDRFLVVPTPEAATAIAAERIAVICQTTTRPDQAEAVVAAVVAKNPGREVRCFDTICGPTRNRQEAAALLLDRVEALVVVGGRDSNNTRELVRLAERRGRPALHVRDAGDLDPAWLAPYEVIGLSAGTSTLDRTIDQVEQALLRIGTERGQPGELAAVAGAAGPVTAPRSAAAGGARPR